MLYSTNIRILKGNIINVLQCVFTEKRFTVRMKSVRTALFKLSLIYLFIYLLIMHSLADRLQ